MQQYRPTKAVVDLDAITSNVRQIIGAFPGFTYYQGVVKADSYGLRGPDVMRAILDGGCNFLCVSLVEEALTVRAEFPDVPVLILVPPPVETLPLLSRQGISVTVATAEQAAAAASVDGLKVHIRVNGGHDFFGGPTSQPEFAALFNSLRQSKAVIEGIYLHNYDGRSQQPTMAEFDVFEAVTVDIDLAEIPVVSTSVSLTLPWLEAKPYATACRIGNIIYGIENDTMGLKNCFQLLSQVTQVVTLRAGQSIGYCEAYKASADTEFIGVVPIGYGDGFAKTNAGRDVFVSGRRLKIATVTMDVTLLVGDADLRAGDEVVLIRDAAHLDEIAEHTGGVAEESISLLNERVYREYRRKTPDSFA
ncbi:MAG: alanine racemase [Propionibacteriaceae bacterium]|nr:alanine racemase [Propionibacteriaceae bacterium]